MREAEGGKEDSLCVSSVADHVLKHVLHSAPSQVT